MKKLLVFASALCILLCACGKDVAETTVTTEKTEQTTMQPTEQTTNAVSEEPIVTEVTHNYGDNVDAKYEVLTLGDEELNTILNNKSEEILKSYIPNISSIRDLGGTAEYDVKLARVYKSDKILSAVFSGSYAIYYENSEEGGEVLYTVNIDPQNGKILSTPDIVDYEKMLAAFNSGKFDKVPDLSAYNPAYGIYPHIAIEETSSGLRLGVYETTSGVYQEVFGYYISLDAASDFLKIQLTTEE